MNSVVCTLLFVALAAAAEIRAPIPTPENKPYNLTFVVPADSNVKKGTAACTAEECKVEADHSVTIQITGVNTEFNAIEINGANNAKIEIPLKKEGAPTTGLPAIEVTGNNIAVDAYRVPFAVTTMRALKSGATTPTPLTVVPKTGGDACNVAAQPCFKASIPAYNVTIAANMEVADVMYTIEPKTPNAYTSLIAIFMPIKCSASAVVALSGVVTALASHLIN